MPYSDVHNVTSQYKSGYDRLRVDEGQTGFFEGRMFRTYDKLNIAAASSLNYRFTAPISFILWLHKMVLTQGGLSCQIVDSTAVFGASGWTQLPIIGVNRMAERRAPFYSSQITIEKGGTITGGTELDYFEVLASSNGLQADALVEGSNEERGLPNTIFGLRLTPLAGVSVASVGVHRLTWEERPSSVPGWNPGDGVK